MAAAHISCLEEREASDKLAVSYPYCLVSMLCQPGGLSLCTIFTHSQSLINITARCRRVVCGADLLTVNKDLFLSFPSTSPVPCIELSAGMDRARASKRMRSCELFVSYNLAITVTFGSGQK